MPPDVPQRTNSRRLRSIHRKMSWEDFERLPRRVGWKHEYYGDSADITPAKLMVVFSLPLAPRAGRDRRGVRPVAPADQKALEAPFLRAFRLAPEYADYPLGRFRKSATAYLTGFFGDVRGRWSDASFVAAVRGRIIGAGRSRSGKGGCCWIASSWTPPMAEGAGRRPWRRGRSPSWPPAARRPCGAASTWPTSRAWPGMSGSAFRRSPMRGSPPTAGALRRGTRAAPAAEASLESRAGASGRVGGVFGRRKPSGSDSWRNETSGPPTLFWIDPARAMNPTLDYLPRLPRRKDFRIGCVGAGFIMRDCHLVAYRQAGFNPVAITSRNPDHAHAVAAQHGIPRVHATSTSCSPTRTSRSSTSPCRPTCSRT